MIMFIFELVMISLIILFILIYSVSESSRRKELGINLQFESKHIYGIPNLELGDNSEIILYQDRLCINNLQTIPLDRFKYAEQVETEKMVLTETQKSIIRKVKANGMLEPKVVVVDGMNGSRANTPGARRERSYIQITYVTKEGTTEQALFLTEYSASFSKGLARRINLDTGAILPQSEDNSSKTQEPYDI